LNPKQVVALLPKIEKKIYDDPSSTSKNPTFVDNVLNFLEKEALPILGKVGGTLLETGIEALLALL
jgi:hypothetical protein